MKYYTSVDRYGNNILLRGVEGGRKVAFKVPFMPTLFMPTDKKTGWHNLEGKNVLPKTFNSMREARQCLDTYSDVHDLTIYGSENYIIQFINDRYPGEIKFERDKVNVTTIDIEVASDDGFPHVQDAACPVTTITMKNNIDNIYRVWGLYDYDPDKCEVEGIDKIQYIQCKDEIELLLSFLSVWNHPDHCPDVVTGWNTRFFDIPYLVRRIQNKIGGDTHKKMSPWGIVDQREIIMFKKPHLIYNLSGIQQLDYLDCFRKFAYTYGQQESYKLDHIAHVVLNERKLSYEEAGNLYTLYKTNYQKFVDYNIKDVQLVDRFEEKLGLITLAMTMAYRGGVNYSDTFGTVQIWDAILYRNLYKQKIVVPPKRIKTKAQFEGAYVKEPKTGMHKWVVSFDLNSLYPNIIVQYNMSPETVLPGKVDKINVEKCLHENIVLEDDNIMAASGVKFSRDKQGCLPQIITQYYNERVEIKTKMIQAKKRYTEAPTKKLENEITILENQQMAIKILMNSLYGALGNRYFRYFANQVAESITLSGQLSIRWAEEAINDELNKLLDTLGKDYVIAIDTDSLYVNMEDVVSKFNPKDPIKFLDKISREHFEKVLAKAYDKLAKKMKVYDNRMEMSREVIADKGVWIAKKRYILNVHDNEGVRYKEPKMKMMGVDAVRSSTPQVCRDKFKEIFKVILEEGESATQDFIARFKKEWKMLKPEDISFPRGCNILGERFNVDTNRKEKFNYSDPNTIYAKGCPVHVRGALLYNHYLIKHALQKTYTTIGDGEKVKFCYLMTPNPIRENIISFPDILPKELDLHSFIDYNKQYDKAFVEPIKHLLDALNWKVEPVATLEEFFG